jgi:hypothetical protein
MPSPGRQARDSCSRAYNHHPPLPFPASYTDQLDALEHGLRAVRDESELVIRHTACPALVAPRRADAEHADALLASLVVTAR